MRDDLDSVGHAYDWWRKCKHREDWRAISQVLLAYLVLKNRKMFDNIKNNITGPGWRGAVSILSTVPTVDWVLLGSGESNKG